MGWGVTDYPSAPIEPPAQYTRCEGTCREDIAEEDNSGACAANDCHREALCFGCSHECRECEGNFCKEHIVVRNMGEKVDGFMALYTCQACDAKRELKKEAA